MSKRLLRKADMSHFAVLLLCHGRPWYNDTLPALRRCGYTGRIFIIVDDLDDKQEEYISKHGHENVYVFNKSFVAMQSDAMNNFNDRRATLFVRNASFDIARDLGLETFLVLDDDYGSFCHKREECERTTRHLDEVFEMFVTYLLNTPIKCIAFSQGGDHMGGYNPQKMYKRKAMNSFFCVTDRPFKFYGVMNDDVNCYLLNGKVGDVFLTYNGFQLDQEDTQSTKGGMTETYKEMGTYLKSFTTVMCSPSNVAIKLMGVNAMRLHHSIDWQRAVPMIISQEYKK